MSNIKAAISCNLDRNLLLTALPLFETEKVQGIEWSFDALFKIKELPFWFHELLQTFSSADSLIGHGIYFSLFSGKWTKQQEDWLVQLKKICNQFNFDHITEHFGFMTGENFHAGAPLSIPFTKQTLALGQDRLKRISNACERPVGLENLAFAFSLDDVKQHGDFLYQLLEPINGLLILDLHNLYCQLHNFEMDYKDLIKNYPLELVREIHISGGSWEDSIIIPDKKIRRDTHDESVPAEVFELLRKTIPKCPNLKYVVLEQLSIALYNDEKRIAFQNDFLKLFEIVQIFSTTNHTQINNFFSAAFSINEPPIEDADLFMQQTKLSNILESATSYENAVSLLQTSGFANSDWQIEKWKPYMLETAIAIAQKWRHGFT